MSNVIPFPSRDATRFPASELADPETQLCEAFRAKLAGRGVELPEEALRQLVRGIASQLEHG